jgi:hypothetical protein
MEGLPAHSKLRCTGQLHNPRLLYWQQQGQQQQQQQQQQQLRQQEPE